MFGENTSTFILTWIFGGQSPSLHTGTLASLWIGNPGIDLVSGPGVEPSPADNYSRVVVGFGDWGFASSTVVDNSSPITFPECQNNDWGTVDYVAILTDYGTPLLIGPLITPKLITVGSIPRFDTHALVAILS